MCGLTGFFSFEKQIDTSKYYDAHLLIKHRGPDDEGFIALINSEPVPFKSDSTVNQFQNLRHIRCVQKSSLILGHSRLSIIDLTHGGHQPFCDKGKNYSLVYNGELFNYIELKEELKRYGYMFFTDSDTEVVLTSYMHWGYEAFDKFNGMWALAIYNRNDHSLVLSRDRFGIKPLYYSFVNGILYFSSEIKFIRKFMNNNTTLNRESVQAYIDRCWINYSDATFWNEINELEPSHFLVFKNAHIEIKKYWNFNPETISYNEKEALEKFAYIFQDSLKLRMRSDVEVGTLLSGGLDSSLIVCTLRKQGLLSHNNFKSFSAIFEDLRFSEKKYIDETIKHVDLNPFFITVKPESLECHMEKLFFHIEQPFRSLAVFSQFLIYQKIKNETNVRVALIGQGADELFGGYSYHYYFLFAGLLKKMRLIKLMKEMVVYQKNRKVNWDFILNNTWRNFLQSRWRTDYFNSMTFREITRSSLREYLMYDDRNSMAHGIESRVPFLDYRLVEFAFTLKEGFKIDNFINKRIERIYAKGIIPEAVRNRKDKAGFTTPQEAWQRKELYGDLQGIYPTLLANSYYGLLKNPDKVLEHYKCYLEGKNNNWPYAWRVYCLYRWLKYNKIA